MVSDKGKNENQYPLKMEFGSGVSCTHFIALAIAAADGDVAVCASLSSGDLKAENVMVEAATNDLKVLSPAINHQYPFFIIHFQCFTLA